ncbi:hypothetical protein [Actinoplanes sp. L3-i22]|uniref:DUF6928 family protein n=1 Tax=Actinoplanes sp. L3-i22 TaxID=2836373 RepID=UPI001C761646|nr:hypothetical protein [Actinoplanes sp. L3-i22]BCY10849.1 hypothetical protein L3i22_059370 [Actinoplanes sp. L3-i22]
MGAKTALLAFADGDLREHLRAAGPSGPAEGLVRRAFPGYGVTPYDDSDLFDGCYPPDDVTCATVLRGADLLADRRLVLDRPSELPGHLLALGAGRRILMHGMHSVVDWLCFAVWEDGSLVRSLSLSPDGGIAENLGEPFAFERPFWDGAHPVEDDDPVEEPYPLPFHPLELGEEALGALFGFVVEGEPRPEHVDACGIRLPRFRVTDPAATE